MFALLDYMGLGQASAETYELEVLSEVPAQEASATPIVFVHGAYFGAWCWQEHFLPYFAARGYHAHALSLRGHGNSGGHERLNAFGIDDYVRDLAMVVERFERPCILVGHSMGGMVVQKYLERHEARAAVLMASVPPSGLTGSVARLMTTDPLLLLRMSMIHVGNPTPEDLDIARRTVFSEDISDEDLRRFARNIQSESHRAIWDMTVGNLPRRWRITPPPMLVLGAEHDALFSPAMVRATARTYGTEAEIFPNMYHGMMLERGWQAVADRIIEWIDEHGF